MRRLLGEQTLSNSIKVLDCTLRDGAYITDGRFGAPAIEGIISKLQDANIDIIECGWLKNPAYIHGTSYYHMPSDLSAYLINKSKRHTYAAMIDLDRYDVACLPDYDGATLDAVRIAFPHGRARGAAEAATIIKQKGYRVYFQILNAFGYSDSELVELADIFNDVSPDCVTIADTFGAMYEEDLERIAGVLDGRIDKATSLGFHSHNNQQLSFALSKRFVDMLAQGGRDLVLDGSLCGMGRGAGNATTELVTSFLNRRHNGGYKLDAIMEAIDTYIEPLRAAYTWGYSAPYMIAGMYCCHVNNIEYLIKNHNASSKDIKDTIASLSREERVKYDYDLLERKYKQSQSLHFKPSNH